MPYGLLGLLIAAGFVVVFVLSDDVSTRAKIIIAVLFAAAWLLPIRHPDFALAGFLLQLLLAIGIAIRFRDRR